MANENRKRIVREATPEEKERHRAIREQVKQDLPELRAWARAAVPPPLGSTTASLLARCLAAKRPSSWTPSTTTRPDTLWPGEAPSFAKL